MSVDTTNGELRFIFRGELGSSSPCVRRLRQVGVLTVSAFSDFLCFPGQISGLYHQRSQKWLLSFDNAHVFDGIKQLSTI